jgi:hypothetical protein
MHFEGHIRVGMGVVWYVLLSPRLSLLPQVAAGFYLSTRYRSELLKQWLISIVT